MNKSMDGRETEVSLFDAHKHKMTLQKDTELIFNRISVLRREEERMLK